MPAYEIYRVTRCVERHSVNASSPADALRRFEAGEASLRSDQVTDVYSVRVLDRDRERDVTSEAETIYEIG